MEIIYIIQLLVFLASFLFVFSLLKILGKEKKAVIQADTPKAIRLGWLRHISAESEALGHFCSKPVYSLFPHHRSQVRQNLIIAGMNDLLSDESVLGAQFFCGSSIGVFSACLALIATLDFRFAFLAGFFGGSLGLLYPSLWIKRKALARQDQIAKDLPFAIDLLTVAIQAGQDFGAAVRLLLDEGIQCPLMDEFRQVMTDVQLGKTRVQALKDMADRICLDEFRNLVAVVSQSVEMGAGLGETFQLQADEMRRRRFHKAERKAARVPSLLIFPTALFIMPATFIVVLTPIILKLLMTVKGL